MIPLEAIEPKFIAAGVSPRWTERIDVLPRMLHALTTSEQPYAYLVPTESRRIQPRA